MAEDIVGDQPGFRPERIAHVFELLRDKMPDQLTGVNEDDAGATFLVTVLMRAQDYWKEKPGEADENPGQLTLALGTLLTNYLEGQATEELEADTLKLRSKLFGEELSGVDDMLEQTTGYLAGYLSKNRHSGNPRRKRVAVPDNARLEQRAASELAQKSGMSEELARRYGALLGLSSQEQLEFYYLLSQTRHRTTDYELTSQQELVVRKIRDAWGTRENVYWTEFQEDRVRALLQHHMTPRQQLDDVRSRLNRSVSQTTVSRELIAGLNRLAGAIEDSRRVRGRPRQ